MRIADPRTDAALPAPAATEPEAFGVFDRCHARSVLAYLMARTGHAEAAADLCAEAFAAALERIEELADVRKRVSRALAALLADLPDDQREALLARVVETRAPAIAGRMRTSEAVVRKRVSRVTSPTSRTPRAAAAVPHRTTDQIGDPMSHRRLAVPAALAALAGALVAAPAALAQAPVPARTITATAAGRVTVNRGVAQNNRAIAAAVDAARDRAIPLAIQNAREEAQRIASASGVTLGAIVSVEETQSGPFFIGPVGGPLGGPYGGEGTFGPGRFCGRIRTAIRRRNAAGQLRPTGRFRTRNGCRVPGEVSQSLTVTFAVA